MRLWRGEFGDPTPLSVSSLSAALTAAAFMKIQEAGRVGWPGDALFAERLTDPIKFHIVLAALGLWSLASLAFAISTGWDLVVAYRRDSGRL